ncbi:MAG: hypothetical protein OEY28_06690 [Nitrospira sp.]|nr:hypothetical protein [Nitrospira sp.]
MNYKWVLSLATVLALISAYLPAQAAFDFPITNIIHEPTADQVGTFISQQQIKNPDYNPVQPNGQPEFLPVYGSGKGGYDNELPSVSGEFYAIGSTTTHDLVVMKNNTGGDIIIDGNETSTDFIKILEIRPKNDVEAKPEQSDPGLDPIQPPKAIYAYAAQVLIPAGATAAVFLVVLKWDEQLDTSPRDYIITFSMFDISTQQTIIVEAPLTVPEVGGPKNNGCASGGNGLPTGLAFLSGVALAAIIRRRRLIKA